MPFVFQYLDIVVVTVGLFTIPFVTSKDILFGVRTGREFRQAALARRSLILFCSMVLAAGLASAVLAGSEYSKQISVVRILLPIGIVGVATVAYYWAYRQLRPYAQRDSNVREAELTTASERVPLSLWLMFVPFVILGGTALYLSLHWMEIPARYPVHYGFDGQPNGWATRSFRGVYGFLLFGALINIWMTVLAFITWFGSRRSSTRRAALSCFAAASVMLASVFSVVPLSTLWHLPPMLVALGVVIASLALVIWMLSRGWSLSDTAPERTAEDRWYAGGIYYNPDDPAVMVQKRSGFGYTFNFGNHWSWVLLAGTAIIVGGGILIVR